MSYNMTYQEAKENAFVMYPSADSILEIGCGDGDRVRVGRRKGHNVFGVDPDDYSKEWRKKGVDIFCKRAPLIDLPYEDDTFEYVITPNAISEFSWDKWAILKEAQRVGNHRFFFKIAIKYESMNIFTNSIEKMRFFIDVISYSTENTLCVECRK